MIRTPKTGAVMVSLIFLFNAGQLSRVPNIPNPGQIASVVSSQIPKTPEDIFVSKLSDCESGGDWSAVNPEDLDHTPSYGRFQFKIGTWKKYVQRYRLWDFSEWEEADYWNALYDGSLQEKIVRKMIVDPAVDLSNEFPACYRRYGYLLG